jgi:uncharacterized protein YkwD
MCNRRRTYSRTFAIMKRTWIMILVGAFFVEIILVLSPFLFESERTTPFVATPSAPASRTPVVRSTTTAPVAHVTPPSSAKVITPFREEQEAPAATSSIALRDTEDATVSVRPSEVVTPSERSVALPGVLVLEKPFVASATPATIVLSEEETGALTRAGILALVNVERAKGDLPPLSYNATLTVIAEVKTLDMITRTYFAHESPDGVDIAGLADRYHYDYLNIGENLAMGDFVSDADVMSGWMNSPGHRANILNPKYTEIGIAAIEGMNDGRMMWYAVQEFGRPAALCPKPDPQLAESITRHEGELATLEVTLTALRETLNVQTLERFVYNAKVDEYNALVSNYNMLISTTKDAIARYNASVEAFNACIAA